MSVSITDSRRSSLASESIARAYTDYQRRIWTIDLRAKSRFEAREWAEAQADSVEKLELYKTVIRSVVQEIGELLEERIDEKQLWMGIKAVYSSRIAERDDWELAETFFNSVTRQIFTTVGVDPQIEFVDTDFETPPTDASGLEYKVYDVPCPPARLVEIILSDYPFDTPFEDRERDLARVAARMEKHLIATGSPPHLERADMLRPVFYRGRAAYLIGRLYCGSLLVPFVLALDNIRDGIIVDAVLFDEDQVSILFSFAHSYFRVLTDRPYDIVHFLKSIMPHKKAAELYISLGYNKHGKTELYRDLLQHLKHSTDRFEIAKGVPGMVMIVFTMPSYDVVFKVIRDRFSEPKDVTRREVMENYRLVFKHDRAGRLIDAQEFEHLEFQRERFSVDLLDELRREASQTVTVEDDRVIVHHAYIERRLDPLNLYVDTATEQEARAVVIDYGQAIKDLMATNIFPGDLLLKNFGVTRHGRVVFYDFDEVCLLTACKFRRIPPASSYEDELAAETWFSVGENDVFPEQFPSFLGLRGSLRQAFIEKHSDLFEVELWRRIQESLARRQLIRIYPYGQEVRLHGTRRD